MSQLWKQILCVGSHLSFCGCFCFVLLRHNNIGRALFTAPLQHWPWWFWRTVCSGRHETQNRVGLLHKLPQPHHHANWQCQMGCPGAGPVSVRACPGRHQCPSQAPSQCFWTSGDLAKAKEQVVRPSARYRNCVHHTSSQWETVVILLREDDGRFKSVTSLKILYCGYISITDGICRKFADFIEFLASVGCLIFHAHIVQWTQIACYCYCYLQKRSVVVFFFVKAKCFCFNSTRIKGGKLDDEIK